MPLARRTHALAIDLLVDHDVVDHPGFDVPAQQPDGTWQRKSITFRPPTHVAADGLAIPTAAEFETWDAALARTPAAHTDTLAFILSALNPSSTQNSELRTQNSFTPWMSRARQQLEAALDLDVHHVPTSGLCDSTAWHFFVLLWFAYAKTDRGGLPSAYNAALAQYRQAHGIHNTHHPIPDLQLGPDLIELPFWIYRVGSPRERLMVRFQNDGSSTIVLGDETVALPAIPRGEDAWKLAGEFQQALTARQLVIRPRALTLTMFVRLFVSDLFIHGIGGALYDQITDSFLQSQFGLAPAYACVSAAWLLPLGPHAPAVTPADISDLRHYRHHLRHNPQSGIDPFTALKTDYAELIAQRQSLIRQIAASMETNRKAGRLERLALYRQLHAIIDQLHAKAPQVLAKLDTQLAAAATVLEQDKVLRYREYYFGLHSMDSLRTLIHKIRDM